jgi:hypothetical protein
MHCRQNRNYIKYQAYILKCIDQNEDKLRKIGFRVRSNSNWLKIKPRSGLNPAYKGGNETCITFSRIPFLARF